MRAKSLITLFSWLTLSLTTSALPTAASEPSTALVEKRTPAWQFYYDVNAATQQTNFAKWSAAGYRMISLSAYGQAPNNKYAAVWVERSGPSFYAIHEASASAYQTFFNTHAAQGYVTTMVTATGPANNPIFAGVMEANGVTNWYHKCGLVWQDMRTEMNNGYANRYYLKSFTEYGTPSDRRYCGVWYYNDQFDKSTAYLSLSYSELPATLISEESKPNWRPYMFSVSEDHFTSTAFTDTDVGSWVAKHDLTAAQLQSEYATQKAAGRYIINLSGGGTGTNTLFSVIFAQWDIPTPRTFRVAGSVTGFQNNAAASTAADTLMENFMKTNGVRQAQLSVGKAGNVILERSYSWSEATRHSTQVTDVFLLASVSKAFLEAAIQTLYNSGKITPGTLVYPLLGYLATHDPRCQKITVDHLLTHYGGLNTSATGYDVTYDMTMVSQMTNQGTAPATLKEVVDYMSNIELDFNPGAGYAYSNYGYILLTYLIEHVTGESYFTYLTNGVLAPGNFDVRTWGTAPSLHTNDPITQESMLTGMSGLTPWSLDVTAAVFGGDDMVKETCFGEGALAASASTLVRFIAKHSVNGIGGRPLFLGRGLQFQSRSGGTAGASAFMQSRNDGLDWAITVNTQDWPGAQTGNDPFNNVLCKTGVPGFLAANAAA